MTARSGVWLHRRPEIGSERAGEGPRRCRVGYSPTSKAFRGTSSRPPDAVVEVNHAAFETAFVQQFESQADVVGQGPLAASHHHWCDEQVALVDQPGLESLGGEFGTAHDEVSARLGLHLPDRFGVEVLLDLRPCGRYGPKRPGVHDLLCCLPDMCEVPQ